MRNVLLSTVLFMGIISVHAQNKVSINNQNMEKKTSAVRLIYPQWQGGIVAHWMPDIPAEDASRGYYLGAQLLNMLAPESSQEVIEVPVSLDINDRETEKGISSRRAILKQTKAALEKLREKAPDRIVTLGGDCSVSVVPFTYLAEKYPGEVACLGMGDEEIMGLLPGKFDASKALIVGLRSWDTGMKERQEKLGIKGLSPEKVAGDSSAILEWLKETGASKVVIHFDLDVLDPAEIIAGVGVEPDGMRIDEVVRVINDIASKYDLVGLTVAEPMPRIAIKIKNMLHQLPLLK